MKCLAYVVGFFRKKKRLDNLSENRTIKLVLSVGWILSAAMDNVFNPHLLGGGGGVTLCSFVTTGFSRYSRAFQYI